MSEIIKRYQDTISLIKSNIENNQNLKFPNIIAVSKTFKLEKILPLIDYGHIDYGENKVQEAIEKWTLIKEKKPNIKIHLIGKLQTNKVKFAIKIFDYIHSLDSIKLAKKIADEEKKQNRKTQLFIQVNIGNEDQKSGVDLKNLTELYSYCKELDLNVIGLMCIPPFEEDSEKYFKEMKILNKKLNLTNLSMGMSSDYLKAIENSATHVRIGSNIFGSRN
ncbi:YggS family pyridoxal phosphate-dependent enzyme [Candidatus Pelagibacter sp.]|nr:YggS family pyridoxal phosphate-dependent enzyme [Candidatus Pelagibacter sp.]